MKKHRQEKLLELISRYEIETQDELIERLREIGYEVTQATISRDIRELKIAKMTTGKGTYRYVLPKHADPSTGPTHKKTRNARMDIPCFLRKNSKKVCDFVLLTTRQIGICSYL